MKEETIDMKEETIEIGKLYDDLLKSGYKIIIKGDYEIMDDLMEQYKKKFDECFPLMLTKGMSEKQIEDFIISLSR